MKSWQAAIGECGVHGCSMYLPLGLGDGVVDDLLVGDVRDGKRKGRGKGWTRESDNVRGTEPERPWWPPKVATRRRVTERCDCGKRRRAMGKMQLKG